MKILSCKIYFIWNSLSTDACKTRENSFNQFCSNCCLINHSFFWVQEVTGFLQLIMKRHMLPLKRSIFYASNVVFLIIGKSIVKINLDMTVLTGFMLHFDALVWWSQAFLIKSRLLISKLQFSNAFN